MKRILENLEIRFYAWHGAEVVMIVAALLAIFSIYFFVRHVGKIRSQPASGKKVLYAIALFLLAVWAAVPSFFSFANNGYLFAISTRYGNNNPDDMIHVFDIVKSIAEGKKGPCPFSRFGQERILASARNMITETRDMGQGGVLDVGQAELFAQYIENYAYVVENYLPYEEGLSFVCYHPGGPPKAFNAPSPRLRERVALIESLAISAKLNPKVTLRILDSFEKELKAFEYNFIPEKDIMRDADGRLQDNMADVKARLPELRAKIAALREKMDSQ